MAHLEFHLLLSDYLREHHLYEAANTLSQQTCDPTSFDQFKKKLDYLVEPKGRRPADSADLAAKRRKLAEAPSVQIQAKNEEVVQKIDSFIGMKRAELDESNTQEFLRQVPSTHPNADPTSCARVDAASLKRNIQIKTSVVVNEEGPLERATHTEDEEIEVVSGVEERISNIEQFLEIVPGKPIPKDVYARIKVLEDKIVSMESETSRLISIGAIPPTAQTFLAHPSLALPKRPSSKGGKGTA